MSDEESYGICIPAEHKERLLRSYESEMKFYEARLEELKGSGTPNPSLEARLEEKMRAASDNYRDADELFVCEDLGPEEEDIETPAEVPQPTDLASPPPSRTPPHS